MPWFDRWTASGDSSTTRVSLRTSTTATWTASSTITSRTTAPTRTFCNRWSKFWNNFFYEFPFRWPTHKHKSDANIFVYTYPGDRSRGRFVCYKIVQFNVQMNMYWGVNQILRWIFTKTGECKRFSFWISLRPNVSFFPGELLRLRLHFYDRSKFSVRFIYVPKKKMLKHNQIENIWIEQIDTFLAACQDGTEMRLPESSVAVEFGPLLLVEAWAHQYTVAHNCEQLKINSLLFSNFY